MTLATGATRTEQGTAGWCYAQAAEEIRRRPALPQPGGGATLERWDALADVAARDLSVARLVEGHHDAMAILHELDASATERFAAVWAARPDALNALRSTTGWVLDGTKPFCSGAGFVDIALVAAVADDGPRLFLVPGDAGEVDEASWTPLGMEATASTTLRFSHVEVAHDAAVGVPGAYVQRPGFGHGGCGVAACWWGGARAVLTDLHRAADLSDPITASELGRASSRLELARLALREAAAQIDAQPDDTELADDLALATRWAVADAAYVVLTTAERHRGTSSLAVDVDANDRMRDLTTYLSQHRDRAAVDLGRRRQPVIPRLA